MNIETGFRLIEAVLDCYESQLRSFRASWSDRLNIPKEEIMGEFVPLIEGVKEKIKSAYTHLGHILELGVKSEVNQSKQIPAPKRIKGAGSVNYD